MARLTLQNAENTAQRNRPWSFRLEYNGASAVNQSGVSSKFWYATGRGTHEPVEIGWGAIGHAPQYQLITWTALVDRVKEKLAKGYDYVDVPYEKMSAANLAKITGGASPVVAAPVAPSIPVAPAAPAAPVVSAPAPQSLLSLGGAVEPDSEHQDHPEGHEGHGLSGP